MNKALKFLTAVLIVWGSVSLLHAAWDFTSGNPPDTYSFGWGSGKAGITASSVGGTMNLFTGSGPSLMLNSTGLGVGTNSPTNTLSVSGNANVTGNTTLSGTLAVTGNLTASGSVIAASGPTQLFTQTTTQISLRADPVGSLILAQEFAYGVASSSYNLCMSTLAATYSYVYLSSTSANNANVAPFKACVN